MPCKRASTHSHSSPWRRRQTRVATAYGPRDDYDSYGTYKAPTFTGYGETLTTTKLKGLWCPSDPTPWKWLVDRKDEAFQHLVDSLEKDIESSYVDATLLEEKLKIRMKRGKDDWGVSLHIVCDKTGEMETKEYAEGWFDAVVLWCGKPIPRSDMRFEWKEGSWEDLRDMDLDIIKDWVLTHVKVPSDAGFMEEEEFE